MKHPERQRVFAALDAIEPQAWADLIEKLVPIVEGQGLLMPSPAVERLRAVIIAEHNA